MNNPNTSRSFNTNDYYFIQSALGGRMYYFTATNKIAGVSHLSESSRAQIETKISSLLKIRAGVLKKQKRCLLERVENLLQKAKDLENEILRNDDAIEVNRLFVENINKTQFHIPPQFDDHAYAFNDARPFTEPMNEDSRPSKKLKLNIVPPTFLRLMKINTKKEWHEWLLKNHPDKVEGRILSAEERDICGKVIEFGKCFN